MKTLFDLSSITVILVMTLTTAITDQECSNLCHNSDKCLAGCQAFDLGLGLESGCDHTCNGSLTLSVTTQFQTCVQDCHVSSKAFLDHLEQALDFPGPSILPQSISNTSLRIRWTRPSLKTTTLSLPTLFVLQSRNTNKQDSWQDLQQLVIDQSEVNVDDLEPFETYMFRVTWILASGLRPLVSEASRSVQTKASGPSSPPELVKVTLVKGLKLNITWTRPRTPRGRIAFYHLTIAEVVEQKHSTMFKVHKEINDQPDQAVFNYVTTPLDYDRKYNVSVVAVSREGVRGMPSSGLARTAAAPSYGEDNSVPFMYFTNHTVLFRKSLADIFDEDNLVWDLPDQVEALDFYDHDIFALLHDNSIWRLSGLEQGQGHVAAHHLALKGDLGQVELEELAVDWLEEELILVVKTEDQGFAFATCGLDGSKSQLALPGLVRYPKSLTQFKADALNGKLVWIEDGTKLFAVDWRCLDAKPMLLWQGQAMKDFAVLHDEEALVVAAEDDFFKVKYLNDDEEEEPQSVTLSGDRLTMQGLRQLFALNNSFYWTNDIGLEMEEFEEDFGHSHVTLKQNVDMQVATLVHPSLHPVPVPTNVQVQLQVTFGIEVDEVVAVVSLTTDSAFKCDQKWNHWLFVISVTNGSDERTIEVGRQEQVTLTVDPDTLYSFRGQARSSRGHSSLSPPFKAKSLAKTKNLVLLWSSSDHLYQGDIGGKSIQTQMSIANVRDIVGDGSVVLVSNGSHILKKVGTHQDLTDVLVSETIDIATIAIEPFAQMVYFSRPDLQQVSRVSYTNSLKHHQEPEMLPMSVLAHRLVIDSDLALLCWLSQHHKIQCSNLNGEQSRVVHQVGLFDNVFIKDLVMDYSNHVLYLVQQRVSEDRLVHQLVSLPLALTGSSATMVTPLKQFQMPLRFFGDKLTWLLPDGDGIAIYDLVGKSLAKQVASQKMRTFAITQEPSYPDNHTKSSIQVVPDPVQDTTVTIINDTILTWHRVTNINFGQVTYEVLIRVADGAAKVKTDLNQVDLQEYFDVASQGHSQVNVTLISRSKWARSQVVEASVFTQEQPASPPDNLRVYFEPEGDATNLEIRWDQPQETHGVLRAYEVRTTFCQDRTCQTFSNATTQTRTSLNMTRESWTSVAVKVQAVNGAGLGRAAKVFLDFKSSRFLAQPVPRLLILRDDNTLDVFDMDTASVVNRYQLPKTKVDHVTFNALDNILYFVESRRHVAKMDLQTLNKQIIHSETPSADISSMTVDFVTGFVYISVVDDDVDQTKVKRIFLASRTDQVLVRDVVANLSVSRVNKIEVNPFHGVLVVSGLSQRQWTLQLIDLREKNPLARPSSAQCTCQSRLAGFSGEFALLQSNYSIIIKVGSQLVVADPDLCHCRDWISLESMTTKQLVTDMSHVFAPSSDLNGVTQLNVDSGLMTWVNIAASSNNNNNSNESHFAAIASFCPACHQLQRLPRECLRPLPMSDATESIDTRSTDVSFSLQLPLMRKNDQLCPLANLLPPTEFTLTYGPGRDQVTYVSMNPTLDPEVMTVDNVQPFTNYSFFLTYGNDRLDRYFKQEYLMTMTVLTKEGKPSAPRNVSAYPVTPHLVRIEWLPPLHLNGAKVDYSISLKHNVSISPVPQSSFRTKKKDKEGPLHFDLPLKSPDTDYLVTVRAHTKAHQISSSPEVKVRTKKQLNPLTLVSKTAHSLDLTWTSPNDPELVGHSLTYYPKDNKTELHNVSDFASTAPNTKYHFSLTELSSGSSYCVQIVVLYRFQGVLLNTSSNHSYKWPPDDSTFFSTDFTIPDPPTQPKLAVEAGLTLIQWSSRPKQGVYRYQLEAKEVMENQTRSDNLTWNVVYEDNQTTWRVSNLKKAKFIFRVRARNDLGWSNFSLESQTIPLMLTNLPIKQSSAPFVAIIISILVLLLTVLVLIILMCRRRGLLYKKKQKASGTSSLGMELKSIGQNPDTLEMLQMENPLYVAEFPTNEELDSLPKIRRAQIEMTRFIGSGAFGDVYEGRASSLSPDMTKPLKVAIKALRKGATSKDQAEFLREAQIMSNLRHDNVLALVGVCLDNDPHYLITELMEGGDLTTFLKNSRGTSTRHPLTKMDLVIIAKDVAEGCAFLETRHFVHRDIAARNCLVSSIDPQQRKVKIGDFGLSRDIYKNNYYRKNGNGFLPVRWMAPESLVDGVFTSQSDVWSFGVLMWEIVSLGQQPYQARSNMEVLKYVKYGGRLDIPDLTPGVMASLMVKCWSHHPDERPTFAEILQIISSVTLSPEDQTRILTLQDLPGLIAHQQPDSKDSLQRGIAESPSQAPTLPVTSSGGGQRHPTRSNGTRDSGVTSPEYLLLQEQQLAASLTASGHSYDTPRSVSSADDTSAMAAYDLPRINGGNFDIAIKPCSTYVNVKDEHVETESRNDSVIS